MPPPPARVYSFSKKALEICCISIYIYIDIYRERERERERERQRERQRETETETERERGIIEGETMFSSQTHN